MGMAMKQKNYFRLVLFILLVWLARLNDAAAQNIILEWDASDSPEVAGYNLYYGTNSGSYPFKIDAGNSTAVTVSNLLAGVTYYFVATAYDANGDESAYSNEAPFVLPGILTLTPGANAGDPALIQFPVAPGHWYEVQASTDFQTWTTLWQTELAVSNSWVQYTDPDTSAFNSRFYRLILH